MPGLSQGTGTLDPRGPQAEAIAELWWLMLALGGAVFVLFAVLLAVGLLRRPADQDAEDTSGQHRWWLLGGGVVLPAVLLVVVLGATVATMRAVSDEPEGDALVVQITGHQWWFEVSYRDAGITTRDELHIPVGRPVELHLTSADVIHSFWVPELGGKMDMLPDGTNVLVLRADVAGEYGAPCAEFCGLEHARMRMHVVVETPEEFTAWIEDQQ